MIDHNPECTSCVHDCPWRRHHFGAPFCDICDDHHEAGDDENDDLVAQGPVCRGHKLARIVDEYQYGADRYAHEQYIGSPIGEYHKPVSTKGWARLDIRVIGNPWGLSVSEISSEDS